MARRKSRRQKTNSKLASEPSALLPKDLEQEFQTPVRKKQRTASGRRIWFPERMKDTNATKLREKGEANEIENLKRTLNERTRELQASRALDQVTDTVSEADVVRCAKDLNNTIYQTAAAIADAHHYSQQNVKELSLQEIESRRSALEASGFEHIPLFLSAYQGGTNDLTLRVQNVLQSVIASSCTAIIRSWTGNIEGNIEEFMDQVLGCMKAREPPFVVKIWEQLTRLHCKLALVDPSEMKAVEWRRQKLATIISSAANILWEAGGVRTVQEGGNFLRENCIEQFEQIHKCCLELDQAILGLKSVKVHLILPSPDCRFESEKMHMLVGEDDHSENTMVAFACEVGLIEEKMLPDGSSSWRTLLHAGVILQSKSLTTQSMGETQRG